MLRSAEAEDALRHVGPDHEYGARLKVFAAPLPPTRNIGHDMETAVLRAVGFQPAEAKPEGACARVACMQLQSAARARTRENGALAGPDAGDDKPVDSRMSELLFSALRMGYAAAGGGSVLQQVRASKTAFVEWLRGQIIGTRARSGASRRPASLHGALPPKPSSSSLPPLLSEPAGENQVFNGPFGPMRLICACAAGRDSRTKGHADCDYTASGRCLRFIENYMQVRMMWGTTDRAVGGRS
jgi:hypothetical protein